MSHGVDPAQSWSDATTTVSVRVPIGHTAKREPVYWEIGVDAHHALVCGMTGSGKTVLLHSFICGLAQRYSPEEIDLYLLDFKQGVSFQYYKHLPHTRVLAMGAEREFGLSVLHRLWVEINENRHAEFKANNCESLAEWRAKNTGKIMPRIILIIDEFQMLFGGNDKIAIEAQEILDRIVSQGRSYGINVVLSSQTLSRVELTSQTQANIHIRIALQLQERDAVKVLERDNDEAKHLQPGGDAIYNDKGGRAGQNVRFQVALLEKNEREQLVQRLAHLAKEQRLQKQQTLFDGTKPASVATNPHLRYFHHQPRPTALPKRYQLLLFVGEPIAIEDSHAHFLLRREGRRHLLIVGTEAETAARTFVVCIHSLGAQLPVQQGHVWLLNLAGDDNIYNTLHALVGCPVSLEHGEAPDVQEFVEKAHAELESRQERRRAGDREPRPPMLLALFGLQRARHLQKVSAAKDTETLAQFKRLLIEGPELGLHVLCWVDAWANLTPRALGQSDVAEFGGRLALRGGDSHKAVNQTSALDLKTDYAMLLSPDQHGRPGKIRCYGPETLAALQGAWKAKREPSR